MRTRHGALTKKSRSPTAKRALIAIVSLLLLTLPAGLRAQQQEDFDEYRLRIGTVWFYSNPSGYIHGTFSGDSATVDFQKNLGFSSYSTFTGKVDWKFTRKNHFYVALTPFYTSRQTTITQDFQFQGQLFKASMVVQSNLHAFLVAPGYQYDIIRRMRGHLGIGVQMDLLNYSGKISATAQVIGTPPVTYGSLSASGSVLAPIPVAGPEFRLYLTDSPKVYVEGNVYGMYFFGYGNMVTSAESVGVRLTKHINATLGYQLGSRLTVKNNDSSKRIGVRFTQQGPVAGLSFSL